MLHANNAIVIADLHVICRMGLCPPQGIRLSDGGWYKPSRLQQVVWDIWENQFWGDWVPRVTRGEPFVLIVNGDAVDGGAHHGNTTHISDNEDDQERLAMEILGPKIALASQYFHVGGTEVHVGPSRVNEERLARQLGAVPDEDGQYCRWDLWMMLGGPEGSLCNFTHHIGVAGSAAYETSALAREYAEACVEAARWGHRKPDVVGRAHRHTCTEVRVQTDRGFGTVFTTGGWQLKTPLCHRVAGARQAEPQIGGSLVRHGDEDCYTRHFIRKLAKPKTVVAVA
jgi:hypothetical protein